MPRLPRINFPGAVFHVMSRGNSGQDIFWADSDRIAFLQDLRDIKTDYPFKLYAYCLMSNHFHFLVQIDQTPLASIIQRLLTGYSRYFNMRRKTCGHVFQGRYKAILCNNQSYLLQVLRYIHLNPINARILEKPSDWHWSSHREYMGADDNPLADTDFPLSIFHEERHQARILYENFVMEGLGINDWSSFMPTPQNHEDIIVEKNSLGSGGYTEDRSEAHSLDDLGNLAEIQTGVALDEMRSGSRRHSITPGRRALITIALKRGHRPSQIAAYLGCSPSSISKIMRRGVKRA